MLIAILILAACGDKSDNENNENSRPPGLDSISDTSILDEYVYQPFQISLPEASYPVNGALVHEDRVIYWYSTSDMTIVVVNMAADGSDRQETNIPVSGLTVRVGGLRVTDEGNYAIVMRTFDEDGNNIIYGVYSPQGARISSKELEIIDVPDGFAIQIEQVAFDDSGNIAIIIGGIGTEDELHLLDKDGTPLGKLAVAYFQSIVRLQDGRIAVSDFSGANYFLHEVDFTKVGLGETFPLSITGVRKVLPAGSDQTYDLLVDDGNYLYGYHLNTNSKTTLLNWLETKLALSPDYHIGFLSNNRIAILYAEFSQAGENVFWMTDLFILTRIPRSDLPEHTVLTIGGFWFTDEIRQEVIAFNRSNHEYQIELRDYRTDGEWDADLNRFRLELITGRGPDIIFDNYSYIPRDSGYFADLYSFIDNDPVLDRSDFFQNVLRLLENEDGSLPVITNNFHIQTQVTLRSTAAQIEPFTFTGLLHRLDKADNPHLYGGWMHRDRFLTNAILMSGDTFIDWKLNRANFDSEDFKNMLEIAARMQEWQGDIIDGTDDIGQEWERLRRGEQLLYEIWIFDPDIYREAQALLGDIIAVGMPTNEGGQHMFREGDCLGINAASQHKDAAWAFMRQLLLPEAAMTNNGLPIRIDLYEQRIEELMTPNVVNGEERPSEIFMGDSSGQSIKLYAMTAEDAAVIREIVDSESLRLRYDSTINKIIEEDTQPFFAGARSAADTARIIQNRAQRYLSERG